MKHTPGPWKIADDNFVYALNPDNVNQFSCEIQAGRDRYGNVTIEREIAANAHLIAAAPEMYKFIEMIAKGNPSFPPRLVFDAAKIITKAEGVETKEETGCQ